MADLTRDEIAARYFEQLMYQPYPMQEEALLAWFSSRQGVLVCAPTGTGKTLIAEAALFEALHTNTVAYYTTPLIALTEQKYREMQEAAVRWGFSSRDIGLVTGNRRENPDAQILVVVAEILFNRLLHPEIWDFDCVSAVVMDEFHSFNDPERGIVWEFTLGLLPSHIRTLLLSATVGNAAEFLYWLRTAHGRDLELVLADERKVPLVFQWVPDRLLTEQIEAMTEGDEITRKTPALVFCFNREECWSIAEQLKGRDMVTREQQAAVQEILKECDLSQGAGPKLKQLLLRGVGVHHAGVLPKYRRLVEDLFQKKLLSVVVCTETLSAGINLPARSVVLPSLVKGPREKRRLIDPSSAHQMFGRAGRPQFDTQGYVFVLAHEDDVKLNRWKEKYDRIPEDTKDPQLLRMKKELKRKMPQRRPDEVYWTEAQFWKLKNSPPTRLVSRGHVPWRLLAYMLQASPEVEPIRRLVSKRLMESGRVEAELRYLDRMLLTLWRAGFAELEPPPPPTALAVPAKKPAFDHRLTSWEFPAKPSPEDHKDSSEEQGEAGMPEYRPIRAIPTEHIWKIAAFRSVNPLYGIFLINQLGVADSQELLQAMESVLELPRSLLNYVRVPGYEELPPGPLAVTRLDPLLLELGLALPDQLTGSRDEDDEEEKEERRRRQRRGFFEERPRVLTLAEKLELLFRYDYPDVADIRITPVWAAGELLEYGDDFNKYITSKSLQKQEGIIFRHLLRLILLLGEFKQICPVELSPETWTGKLDDLIRRFSEICRRVDPTSTEQALEQVETDTVVDD
ncbi:MAG: DEAD/DEAH box helicase [Thermogutta sp.]